MFDIANFKYRNGCFSKFLYSIAVFLANILVFCLATHAQSISTFNTQKLISQYQTQIYTTDDGLPSNTVLSMLVGSKGYLWVATFNGLARFDGIRFVNYTKFNTSGLPTNNILTLASAGSDNHKIWIGTNGGGLSLFDGQSCRTFTRAQGLNSDIVSFLYTDQKNRLLICTRSGINSLVNSKISSPDIFKPLVGQDISSVYQDKTGKYWVGTRSAGLWCSEGQTLKPYIVADSAFRSHAITRIREDSLGNIWIGSQGAGILAINKKGVCNYIKVISGLPSDYVVSHCEFPMGNIWIGTQKGLCLYQNGQISVLSSRISELGDNIYFLESDNQGNLWAGLKNGGLMRLSDSRFINFTKQEGLEGNLVNCIAEDAKGVLWIATDQGLNSLDYTKKQSLAINQTKNLPQDRIRDLLFDSKGRLWAALHGGLAMREPNQKGDFQLFTPTQGLASDRCRVVIEDDKGAIWVGTSAGISVYINKKFVSINKKNGLSNDFIMSLFQDSDKNIWIGTDGGGLNKIKNRVLSIYTTKNGLCSDVVFKVRQDSKGQIWICTSEGISAWTGKKGFVNIGAAQGLDTEAVFDMVEDLKGYFWLTTNVGIARIKADSLRAYIKSDSANRKRLAFIFFDKNDGLNANECTGAGKSYRAANGVCWFATTGGAAVIDPQRIRFSKKSVSIMFEKLFADEQQIDINSSNISLKPGTLRIEINYNAPCLYGAEKIKYKYKLEPFDREWQIGDARRNALYTNLPPNNYTLKVLASNNDGIWAPEPAYLHFSIQPFFYQTNWFYGLVCLAIAILILIIYRTRIMVLKRKNQELERLVGIRTIQVSQKAQQLETSLVRISDSIRYAQRIQQAFLPESADISDAFGQGFVFFMPKDIVSGDFYWFRQKGDTLIIACADCTGHGVPGAFMTAMSNAYLNSIINEANILEPSQIIRHLDLLISQTLNKSAGKHMSDGMDIAVCSYHKPSRRLSFAGAKRSLLTITNDIIGELKGDRFSLGSLKYNQNTHNPTNHTIELNPGDSFYMYSDGFTDQYDHSNKHKYMTKRLRKLIMEIYKDPMESQHNSIKQAFLKWKGENGQTDDIVVIGIQV